ncbi:MAG: hypothetical protein HC881_10030 [Leptolyngbyaceae cyanobacterium SL_7_1]|nr:hypothetical protein [Leptolyngbyaceae cyanobacterium SL_7_1]
MARKSKEFSELLNHQPSAREQEKAMKRLQKRVEQGVLGDSIGGVVIDPEGEEKMSAVLEAFVEPYLDEATNRDEQQMLFSFAVIAWNMALLPEEKRSEGLEILTQQLGENQAASAEVQEILEEMIERKQLFFADNKRQILDFELSGRGRSLNLSVVSTPTLTETDQED